MAVAAHRDGHLHGHRSGAARDAKGARSQGLSEAEERVLAALSRRPLGLYPVASVARAAGLDRDGARLALARLVELGLVTGESEPVPSRPVRREVVWRLVVEAAWSQYCDVLRFTKLPRVLPAAMPERLPERFAHLFWWGDTSLYELPRDAAFVAEQILTGPDVTSWGWALLALPCGALERVAGRPHVPEDRRELIVNTLAYRRAEPV
ncbi:MAG: hypothetical protein OXC00_10580 [Acidimicrobiaceae bacterium]|nr:hypothetical protein [Acidimicrobiaceae bacterium]